MSYSNIIHPVRQAKEYSERLYRGRLLFQDEEAEWFEASVAVLTYPARL